VINFAICGFGFMGSTHARCLAGRSDARLCAIVDDNLSNLESADREGNLIQCVRKQCWPDECDPESSLEAVELAICLGNEQAAEDASGRSTLRSCPSSDTTNASPPLRAFNCSILYGERVRSFRNGNRQEALPFIP